MFSEKPQRQMIPAPAGQLEVQSCLGDPAGSLRHRSLLALIAHPHPQHGGTMTNKVVATLARAYQQLGVATVIFNFRGVGASTGSFDEGVGEKADLLAVAQWAQAQMPQAELLLAGFSFGSAMAAAASWVLSPQQLVLVAPPVERYSYDRAGAFPCPVAVLVGEADELVDVAGLTEWANGLKPPASGHISYTVLPGTGHFFHGQLHAVRQWLQNITAQWAGIELD